MNERDPKLEEALRAHLREEPPSALDAKILAAAHQAVASGPRKAGSEATRPQRWWMPLAAAAAIGVIAIGVVQQMPKDSAIDATSVTSAPVPAPVPAPAPKIAEKVAPSAEQAPASAVAPMQQPAPTQQPAPASTPAAVPAPAPARDASAMPKKQKEAEMARSTEPSTASPPRAVPPPPAAAPAPAPAAAPPASTGLFASRENKAVAEPAPFPASPPPLLQKTETASAEAKRDEPREAQLADARKDTFANRQSSAAAGAAAPVPPPAAAPAAAPPAPSFAARTRSQENAGAIAQQSAKAGSEYDALARDPDAWIVRIRKLRDEGNTAQAVRELREFRALVPDAERKLPQDLKSLQP